MSKVITQEVIENFLHGEDSEKYIVAIEYDYKSNRIYKIIQDPVKGKIVKTDTFVPFLWVGDLTGLDFYKNSKSLQKRKMAEYSIMISPLDTYGNVRLEAGLRYLVKSYKGYSALINFFKQGGIDPWGEKYKHLFQILSVEEQYLVQKKKRLFKGIEEYSEVHKMVFDIETEGLDPEIHKINLIGVKDNRGFRLLINAHGEDGEKRCIETFFKVIREINPTIIGGHNSASFDFPFIKRRMEINKMNVDEITKIISNNGLRIKKGILKLASEIEPYDQYKLWGFNVIDTSHSVRRAQAINSEIKSWGLKYITKYLEKEKPNRIYIDGAHISRIYLGKDSYYVNPKSGGWRKIGDPGTERLQERFPGKYEIWSGRKLVEQYLDDDLYETMVADDSFSQSTFLLSKLVPTTYERVATMGTATLWKIIMLAWSYDHNLALPEKGEKRSITGGLSRLLKVGYSKNIVKFDYKSLYPSIHIVFDNFPDCDVTGVQKALLEYFLRIRFHYKQLNIEYEKTNTELSEFYDRKQLPLKIFINAYFGSVSAPLVFLWGDMDNGEFTTCTGRQFLRMMIMWFMKKKYVPLVMDSVEFDTPVYLKDQDNNLIILPICDLFNENSYNSKYMSPDNLRDFSKKDYKILTRNGWKEIKYVYRHMTNKPIHKLVTKDRLVCCTSDHSVFQNGKQIKPTELLRGDKIDIIEIPVLKSENYITDKKAKLIGYFIGDDTIVYREGNFALNDNDKEILKKYKDFTKEEYIELYKWFNKNCYTSYKQKMIPKEILNGTEKILKAFMSGYHNNDVWYDNFNITQKSKVCIAALSYILKRLQIEYNITIRKNNSNTQSLIVGKDKNNTIKSQKNKRRPSEIWFNEILHNEERHVYDISTEDGTFVGGIGGVLLKNTDGVNFSTPDDVNSHVYIGKGINSSVEKGKEYRGIDADMAEFNDIFMRGVMGLDIDYLSPACINIARKNYAIKLIKKGKEKIKLTGNTIKSKKLPQYIEEFIDEGFRLLLNGDGKGFINYYYEYFEKIYNQQIPLSKIANKARVKQSVDDYKKYIKKKTKSGSLMARQAHMELIMKDEYPATLGETIYYVNNGRTKSSGDVQRKTRYEKKYTRKELEEYYQKHKKKPSTITEIEINCYRISESDIALFPDKTGEYNVARYVSTFNKRIQPLLVVFKPEIRDSILIEKPEDRQYFTDLQCELDSGTPLKESGQDKLDDVMTLSDTEVIFWNKINMDPFFMYPEGTLELVDEYWVNYNKKVLKSEANSKKLNEDEIIETDGNDYAYHTEPT
jgi:DNA polymerase elongation subunit (family B)